jgi:hypothetical protein
MGLLKIAYIWARTKRPASFSSAGMDGRDVFSHPERE